MLVGVRSRGGGFVILVGFGIRVEVLGLGFSGVGFGSEVSGLVYPPSFRCIITVGSEFRA